MIKDSIKSLQQEYEKYKPKTLEEIGVNQDSILKE